MHQSSLEMGHLNIHVPTSNNDPTVKKLEYQMPYFSMSVSLWFALYFFTLFLTGSDTELHTLFCFRIKRRHIQLVAQS